MSDTRQSTIVSVLREAADALESKDREAQAHIPRKGVVLLAECGDCGAICTVDDLAKSLFEVDDLPERLDVGGEVPAGECECGALAYVVRRPRGQS